MLPVATTFIKARQWPLLIIYLLICLPFLLSLILFENTAKEQSAFVILSLITHILFLFIWYLTANIEIQIYNDSFVYKTAFRRKEMKWNELMESSFDYDVNERSVNVHWIFESYNSRIVIEPFYFSRSNNQLLAETVVAKCRQANVSAAVRQIAGGKFPWYLF